MLEKEISKIFGKDSARIFGKYVKNVYETKDPMWLYHPLSFLAEDFYGADVNYPEVQQYYKKINGTNIALPPPKSKSDIDVFTAIKNRRSRRAFKDKPVSLEELSTLLYYTLGITGRSWWGGPKRAYPSAGGLQPIEAYVAVKKVDDLVQGIYHYYPPENSLQLIKEGDFSYQLQMACLDQEHVGEAPISILLTVVYPRTARKYSYRSYRYVHWDAGFAGQNIYLTAEALGLGTVAVGAFYDEKICELFELDCKLEFPMLLFPVGKRK